MKRILAILLACILPFLTGCAEELRQNTDFSIVASFYPVYIFTRNVTQGAKDVTVSVMAGNEIGCLHDYQLMPADMRRLEDAEAFVVNGAGMESFLSDVAAELPYLAQIDTSAGIDIGFDGNSHIWLSVDNAIVQVQNIADGLAALDSENAQLYRENASAYIARLRALKDELDAAMAPYKGRKIITFHEAFPYFASEYGLEVAAVIERESGTEPSARELGDIIQTVRAAGIQAIFAEPLYPATSADTIAKETGARVYTLDPVTSGEFSLTAYEDAMRQNIAVFKEAFADEN